MRQRGETEGRERRRHGGRERGSELGMPDLGFQIVNPYSLAPLTSSPGFVVTFRSLFSYIYGCQIKCKSPVTFEFWIIF